MLDPLASYHMALRATRASGYPNMQFLAPHPYEMAWQAQQNQGSPTPFAYNTGRQMRMNNVFAGVDPSRQGLRSPNGYIPPRTQNYGRIAALRSQSYVPPQRQHPLGDRFYLTD